MTPGDADMTVAGPPTDRVVRVLGGDAERIAGAMAHGPADLPAVITHWPRPAAAPAAFVRAVLDDLDGVATGLFPAWLPGAEHIPGPGGAGLAAVRAIAAKHAAASRHFRPFLMDLAGRALTGTPADPTRFSLLIRATGLARVIAATFRRARTVLLVPAPGTLSTSAQHSLAAGCEWLAGTAGIGVWLTGAPLAGIDWFPTVVLELDAPHDPPEVLGKPHPRSAVEAALEAALARHDWAAGRVWNQTYRFDAFSPPIRLDLVWPAERCVVELDGPEHCDPVVFEADRRRDVRLQLDGYAVLRFTNARIRYDIGIVVAQLERFLETRRTDTREGPQDGRR
jgi:very-short-patch-repair endonuclease